MELPAIMSSAQLIIPPLAALLHTRQLTRRKVFGRSPQPALPLAVAPLKPTKEAPASPTRDRLFYYLTMRS